MAELPPMPENSFDTDNVWSANTVGGKRLTWREAYEHERETNQRLGRFASLLSDLDRCEHGRHEGDVCSSCRGPSKGNPFLRVINDASGRAPFAQLHAEPRQIGFTLYGGPIIVPECEAMHDADAWEAK